MEGASFAIAASAACLDTTVSLMLTGTPTIKAGNVAGRIARVPPAQGAGAGTGTGVVPPDDFSLEPGDQIAIHIDGIGTLTTGVERGG